MIDKLLQALDRFLQIHLQQAVDLLILQRLYVILHAVKRAVQLIVQLFLLHDRISLCAHPEQVLIAADPTVDRTFIKKPLDRRDLLLYLGKLPQMLPVHM